MGRKSQTTWYHPYSPQGLYLGHAWCPAPV